MIAITNLLAGVDVNPDCHRPLFSFRRVEWGNRFRRQRGRTRVQIGSFVRPVLLVFPTPILLPSTPSLTGAASPAPVYGGLREKRRPALMPFIRVSRSPKQDRLPLWMHKPFPISAPPDRGVLAKIGRSVFPLSIKVGQGRSGRGPPRSGPWPRCRSHHPEILRCANACPWSLAPILHQKDLTDG